MFYFEDFSLIMGSPKQDFRIEACIVILVHYLQNKMELGKTSYSVDTYRYHRQDNFWLLAHILGQIPNNFLLLAPYSEKCHSTFLFLRFQFAGNYWYFLQKLLFNVENCNLTLSAILGPSRRVRQKSQLTLLSRTNYKSLLKFTPPENRRKIVR